MNIKEKLRNLRHSGLSFCVFRYPEEQNVQLVVQSGSTLTHAENGIVLHPFSTEERPTHYLGNAFIGNLADWNRVSDHRVSEKENPRPSDRKIFSRDEYTERCAKAIDRIRSTALDKVVLNVIKEFRTDEAPEELFIRALKAYQDAFVHWTFIQGELSWLGASPELLLKRESNRFETMSLAGTRVQGSDPMTFKEEEEQAIVTSFIINTLDELGVKEQVISEVSEKRTGHLIHLCNHIHFESQLETEQILTALHPTPAVCGLPRDIAFDTLKDLDMMGRDYYCGYIGFREVDHAEYYVNLRCMDLTDGRALVFVGGGVTADSIPQEEWEEMNQKSLTMGRILE